jgi:hypothetical protein
LHMHIVAMCGAVACLILHVVVYVPLLRHIHGPTTSNVKNK